MYKTERNGKEIEREGDREINYSGMINLTCPNATILIS
jgi:hypothetical protein